MSDARRARKLAKTNVRVQKLYARGDEITRDAKKFQKTVKRATKQEQQKADAKAARKGNGKRR
jgi:polygalacturonase